MIKNQWYAILPSKEVKAHKIVAVKRMGLDLCLFRNDDGDVGCLVDQCSHRGAAISKGIHHGNCVACPFHGIRFDKDGKTVLVPANGKVAKAEERFNVTSYLAKEAHDMIYLWYGDKEKATEQLPFFDDLIKEGTVYSEMSDCWNAHYSRCIENQLDVVHVPFVHYNTIGRGNKTVVNGPALEVKDKFLVLSANNSVDEGQEPIKASELAINPHMNLRFMFPNVWQNYISDHIRVVIFFVPVDDEHTIFYIRFYTDQFKMKTLNQLTAFVGRYMNRIIERQDKRVVETQRPKASTLISGEHLLRGDSPIIMYRKIRDTLKKEADET
ncbi:aromatic ring-hydroxylating oxygenase subunit alpha [Anaerorhabdus furcosa]|uniref:Phenylpropionate dioxygenase, large terminal subunit n=1 Tax=Anaerorhabdus furcosa TaxID=118967 RepID=A0A1T4MLQ1_9FIRM|nr:aromatic ring-hydroxylating dioxygenase subunit alpha [Anaerorhabdus furcosa]SJZ67912.1 Phenylpropionate dioxygenase, large terminal subunit [Anaerorhabdus furcosa]